MKKFLVATVFWFAGAATQALITSWLLQEGIVSAGQQLTAGILFLVFLALTGSFALFSKDDINETKSGRGQDKDNAYAPNV